MIREEGMLCGGTSGAVLWAAIDYAKKNNLDENHRLVIVAPDNIRNYITKFVSIPWMCGFGFYPPEKLVGNDENHRMKGLSIDKLGL